jgi:hypothetical protein
MCPEFVKDGRELLWKAIGMYGDNRQVREAGYKYSCVCSLLVRIISALLDTIPNQHHC